MRKLRKAFTVTAVALGVLATTGMASANGYDRTSVGFSIGGFSIGFASGGHSDYCRPVRRDHVEVVVRDRDSRRDWGNDRRDHRDRR